jgi:hypothetical protein
VLLVEEVGLVLLLCLDHAQLEGKLEIVFIVSVAIDAPGFLRACVIGRVVVCVCMWL